MKPQLGILLKLPVPGQVKTRLAKTVGPEAAAQAFEWMVDEVLTRTDSSHWNRTLFGEPRHPLTAYESAYPGFPVRHQSGEDLGQRMDRAFSELLPHGPTVLIGTDCVDLTPELMDEAFAKLNEVPLVLGPAKDGGYYLIGLSRPVPQLLQGIAWSTQNVLSQTLEQAARAGVPHHQLTPLQDIDTEEELKEVRPDWLAKLTK